MRPSLLAQNWNMLKGPSQLQLTPESLLLVHYRAASPSAQSCLLLWRYFSIWWTLSDKTFTWSCFCFFSFLFFKFFFFLGVYSCFRSRNPLQDSCLENSMDRGGWLAPIYGISKSQTWQVTKCWAHIVALQCYISFCCTTNWVSCISSLFFRFTSDLGHHRGLRRVSHTPI